MKAERHILVILGMHRSGTSSVAGLLCQIGDGAPRTLYGPHSTNLRGHWESEPVFRFNDRLLERLGSRWADWRKLDLDRLTQDDVTEAVAILDSEYPDARFPVVKDPRMCRLMPFWDRVFAAWGGKVHVIMPLRSPLDVALSLQSRDGMPLEAGGLLWLRHVLEAEADTRQGPRLVFGWDDFMRDWRTPLAAMRALTDGTLPEPDATLAAALDGFLSGDLRHHETAPDAMERHPAMHVWMTQGYRLLRDLIETESGTTHAALDALHAKFDETSDLMAAFNGHLEQNAHLRAENATLAVKTESQATVIETATQMSKNYRKMAENHASELASHRKYAAIQKQMMKNYEESLASQAAEIEAHKQATKVAQEMADNFRAMSENYRKDAELNQATIILLKEMISNYKTMIDNYLNENENQKNIIDQSSEMIGNYKSMIDNYLNENESQKSMIEQSAEMEKNYKSMIKNFTTETKSQKKMISSAVQMAENYKAMLDNYKTAYESLTAQLEQK